MIKIEMTFNSIAEMLTTLGAASASAAVVTGTTDTTKPAGANKTKPKDTPAADPKPEAEAPKPTGPKREDVSAKVVMLATKSVDAATAVLSKFGVAKARELKDEDLAEALKATEAALAQLDMA